ncbi:MAG: hypothetical protein K8F27_08530 [Sulfuricellaceae bacterium]|nr:hypothetical protein [Sulfuricellaceae bacterium]
MHPTNIVVIDSAQLPADVDFPLLQAAKYRWMQYPRVAPADFIDICSRADVLLSLATPLSAALLDELPRLKALIAPPGVATACDRQALAQRGIALAATAAGLENAVAFCRETVDAIEAYIADHGTSPR